MVTLYINQSDSYCGHCGKGCDPHEIVHETWQGLDALAISRRDDLDYPLPGCGERYTAVSSDYNMKDLIEVIKKMRPDLPYNKWLD